MPVNGENIPAKRHKLEQVEIFEVTGDEIDSIEREAVNVGTDLQFCLVLIPVALTLFATLFLTTITNPRVYIVFFIVAFGSLVFGIYFAVRWFPERRSFKKCLDKIRNRRVGPVGQEGKELAVGELADLPSSEPPPTQGGQQ